MFSRSAFLARGAEKQASSTSKTTSLVALAIPVYDGCSWIGVRDGVRATRNRYCSCWKQGCGLTTLLAASGAPRASLVDTGERERSKARTVSFTPSLVSFQQQQQASHVTLHEWQGRGPRVEHRGQTPSEKEPERRENRQRSLSRSLCSALISLSGCVCLSLMDTNISQARSDVDA